MTALEAEASCRPTAALLEGETLAFAQGEGVGERAGGMAERADVLAYLARKKANAVLVAERSREFAEDARAIVRQIEILADDIRGGLHEGAAFTSVVLADESPAGPTAALLEDTPSAATDPYPFTGHRTVAAIDGAGA